MCWPLEFLNFFGIKLGKIHDERVRTMVVNHAVDCSSWSNCLIGGILRPELLPCQS